MEKVSRVKAAKRIAINYCKSFTLSPTWASYPRSPRGAVPASQKDNSPLDLLQRVFPEAPPETLLELLGPNKSQSLEQIINIAPQLIREMERALPEDPASEGGKEKEEETLSSLKEDEGDNAMNSVPPLAETVWPGDTTHTAHVRFLRPKHRPSSPRDYKLLLVLIHGLWGDSKTSWESVCYDKADPHKEEFWPGQIADFLTDQGKPTACLSLGYPSNMLAPEGSAELLRFYLSTFLINNNLTGIPIAFFGHSLGGVIIGQMLLDEAKSSSSSSSSSPLTGNDGGLLDQTKAIYLFECPFRPGNYVRLAVAGFRDGFGWACDHLRCFLANCGHQKGKLGEFREAFVALLRSRNIVVANFIDSRGNDGIWKSASDESGQRAADLGYAKPIFINLKKAHGIGRGHRHQHMSKPCFSCSLDPRIPSIQQTLLGLWSSAVVPSSSSSTSSLQCCAGTASVKISRSDASGATDRRVAKKGLTP